MAVRSTPSIFRIRIIRRMLHQVERFLAIEAASGIVLVLAATAALFLANSRWRNAYAYLWHLPVRVGVGQLTFEHDLHFWINDGLMTIFFFVVALEIRREIHSGELNGMRRSALPLAGALGGMLVPALIFFAFNMGRESSVGWAIPMATDIAFAAGALALLGLRVPPALRVFLLALAIIDDIGAIVVIALFYSTHTAAIGIALIASGIAAIFFMQILGFRSAFAYAVPALIIWAGAYHAGIHPTLAGVIVGLMTPVKTNRGIEPELDQVSPSQKLQNALHHWVAFGAMPLFAFANAGVSIEQIGLRGDAISVFLGIFLGMSAGKPIGILGLSWFAARLGLVSLPNGVSWNQVAIPGVAGGIGFTMALFIAQLAFPDSPLLDTAKLAILCASGLSGLLSLVLGYLFLSRPQRN